MKNRKTDRSATSGRPWPRAAVGRADLVRLLDTLPTGMETSIGELAGFDWTPVVSLPEPTLTPFISSSPPPATSRPSAVPSVQGERPPLQAPMWAVTEIEELAPPPPSSDKGDAFDPDGEVFEHELVGDSTATLPARRRLSPERRMGVFLRREVRSRYRRSDIDTPALVRCLTQGDWPAHLPRLTGLHWSAEVAVVIDAHEAVFPLVQDFEELVRWVSAQSGRRTPIYWFNPHKGFFRHDATRLGRPWCPVPADAPRGATHWLLVGDLGIFSAVSPEPTRWWHEIQRHQRRGGSVSVLLPSGRSATAAVLPRMVTVYRWDHGRPLVAERAAGVGFRPAQTVASGGLTRRLLRACAMAVVIDADLLRALRLLLGLPVESEVEVWRHAWVDACALGFQIKPQHLAELRLELKARVALAVRDQLAELIRLHHQQASPLILMEEAALAADLAGPDQLSAAREVWQKAARTLMQAPNSSIARAIARYVRRTAGRAHPELWACVPDLARTWVEASVWQIQDGEVIPLGVPGNIVQEVLDRHAQGLGRPETLCLVQRGHAIWLQRQPPGRGQSLLAQVKPVPGVLVLNPEGGWHGWFTPGEQPVEVCSTRSPGVWRIQSVRQRLTVAPIRRPTGIDGWRRDQFGLAADWDQSWPPVRTFRSLPPGLAGDMPSWKAEQPPKVADGWGSFLRRLKGRGVMPSEIPLQIDEFGVSLALNFKGVVQVFRYIPAGIFWMGSPENEPFRDSDEGPRHLVKLTEGYWLADTACTQALWQAVMGNNPSHFTGDPELPVDSVSWDDAQKFLGRLKKYLPDSCEAELPTEAQWEYACRAGTKTSYWFGESISVEQAHFGQPSGSGRTVPAKARPANAWGLYQMHGNVWEWCAGSRRQYSAQAVENPPDGQDQSSRALRGGSWRSVAGNARSAFRYGAPRVSRFQCFGFRFSLRSIKPG